MSSIKEWRPWKDKEIISDPPDYVISVADPKPSEIYFHAEDGEDVGRIWDNVGVMDFEGVLCQSAEILVSVLPKLGYGWMRDDGVYYSLDLHIGGFESDGVTLKPGPYPGITGKCSPTLREFLTIVNTLIVKAGR